MTKIHNYTVRTWPETVAGEPGYSYEIRDAERRWCGGGWSRGKKKDALDDARTQIAQLQAKAAERQAVAS